MSVRTGVVHFSMTCIATPVSMLQRISRGSHLRLQVGRPGDKSFNGASVVNVYSNDRDSVLSFPMAGDPAMPIDFPRKTRYSLPGTYLNDDSDTLHV